jgi:hypothetical protein
LIRHPSDGCFLTGIRRAHIVPEQNRRTASYCIARSKRDELDTVYAYTSMVKRCNAAIDLPGLTYDIHKSGYLIPTNSKHEFISAPISIPHTSGARTQTWPPPIRGPKEIQAKNASRRAQETQPVRP